MYQHELFSFFPIYSHIAEFILAEAPHKPHTSLIFSCKGLKPLPLCLKLRQALQNELPAPQSHYPVQISYSTHGTGFEVMPQTGCTVRLLYLPHDCFQIPLHEASFPKAFHQTLPKIEQACQTLKEICSTTDCSAILWHPETTKNNTELQKRFSEILPTVFPKIRFAQVIPDRSQSQRDSKWTPPIFGDLLAVLPSVQLAYLLKGWHRPELRSKGLIYHPTFGLLANQEIENILQFCQELRVQGSSMKWNFKKV